MYEHPILGQLQHDDARQSWRAVEGNMDDGFVLPQDSAVECDHGGYCVCFTHDYGRWWVLDGDDALGDCFINCERTVCHVSIDERTKKMSIRACHDEGEFPYGAPKVTNVMKALAKAAKSHLEAKDNHEDFVLGLCRATADSLYAEALKFMATLPVIFDVMEQSLTDTPDLDMCVVRRILSGTTRDQEWWVTLGIRYTRCVTAVADTKNEAYAAALFLLRTENKDYHKLPKLHSDHIDGAISYDSIRYSRYGVEAVVRSLDYDITKYWHDKTNQAR